MPVQTSDTRVYIKTFDHHHLEQLIRTHDQKILIWKFDWVTQ